ncbi:hypothetical protein GJAV_G00151970 [Gymnothorax javanicus]|nr:hypothetical protein GJAV_G00151970 [Gymnothorax javanicus]
MSGMFNKLTAILLKELDHGGSLKSVNDVCESTSMDVLSIVKIVKTKKLRLLTKKVYHPTPVKLEHLLNTDTVDLGECKEHSIGAVDLSQQLQGNCGIKVLMPSVDETEVSGEAEITLSATQIKLQSVSVDYEKLSRLLQKSKVNKDHLLIGEMNANENIVGLGVVYKVMKNENSMTLEKTTKGSASAKIPASKFASVKASAGASSMLRLELNKGCVLGYELHPLCVKRESLRMIQVVNPQHDAIRCAQYAVSSTVRMIQDIKWEPCALRSMNRVMKTVECFPIVEVRERIVSDDDDEIRSFGRRPDTGGYEAEDLTQIPQDQELEKECFGRHPEEWTSTHKVRELSVSDDDFEKQSFGRRPEEWTSTHKVRELSVSDDEYEIRSFGRRPGKKS